MLLPAPDGPVMAVNSPRETVNETASSAHLFAAALVNFSQRLGGDDRGVFLG